MAKIKRSLVAAVDCCDNGVAMHSAACAKAVVRTK